MQNFDVGIIGAGVAGAFAAYKISKDHKKLKTLLVELGAAPMKRRHQLFGWLGGLPGSDGKLYINDIKNISSLVGQRKVQAAEKWFYKSVEDILNFELTKDNNITSVAEKRLTKNGFQYELNNYYQLYPKDIHSLSKYISEYVCDTKYITTSFDNDEVEIIKDKKYFIIKTENTEYKCKKLLICTGRAGWRWASEIFKKFNLIKNNNTVKIGIKAEISADLMKDFNYSNCIIKKNNLEVGALSWEGTVIPEDHLNFAITAFRSNEDRWKTDKVSFNVLEERTFENNGFEQTDRLGQLTFILGNDRIIKERILTLVNGKSKMSILKEYDWLKDTMNNVNSIIPDFIQKGYFYAPNMLPMAPKIDINNSLSTEIDNLFVAGESAGKIGIFSAILSGIIAADSLAI